MLSHPPVQDSGADCAKFQKSELDHKFNKRALERPYTSKQSWGKTYGEHKRHLEFSHEQYRELQKYAKEVGIFFTASGMDEVMAFVFFFFLFSRFVFGLFMPLLMVESIRQERGREMGEDTRQSPPDSGVEPGARRQAGLAA